MLRTTVIAITGSVGKTTAKECLAAILAKHGSTCKARYNQNDQYGVPGAIRSMRPWHRFAVIEVGTARPGDVARSARLVKPDIAIVLAVARTHTNQFASLDATAREKSALLEHVGRNGVVILNGDDPRVAAMSPRRRLRTVRFGTSERVEYRALSAMQEVLAAATAARRGVVFSDASDWRLKPRQRLRKTATELAQHCDFAVFIGSHAHRLCDVCPELRPAFDLERALEPTAAKPAFVRADKPAR